MGTTTNYAFRYPAAGASNNPPSDIENLASDVDTELKSIHDALAAAIPPLDSTGSDITASAPGDTSGAGTSGDSARADHKHGREAALAAGAAGNITASAPADTVLAGSTGKYADAGHKHARESATTIITGNATSTVSSNGPLMAISLAAGTWLISVLAQFVSTSSSPATGAISPSGTTGITLSGVQVGAGTATGSGAEVQCALTLKAVVTGTGQVLTINAAITGSGEFLGGGSPVTGYTAISSP